MKRAQKSNLSAGKIDRTSYCFEITFKDKTKKFLCSENKMITLDDIDYYPYSGLWLEKCIFNDSSQNKAIIHGIFEDNGIRREDCLAGAEVKIIIVKSSIAQHFITYYCSEFEKNDLDFYLKCEPESVKYEQSLLKLFSKTCRANFGDDKCAINPRKYAKKYDIESISANLISCFEIQEIADFYKGGMALLGSHNKSYEYNIKAHYGNIIKLEKPLLSIYEFEKTVTLIPTCDKNFRTCCNKFNNAVNFRGEPGIPEYNILKN